MLATPASTQSKIHMRELVSGGGTGEMLGGADDGLFEGDQERGDPERGASERGDPERGAEDGTRDGGFVESAGGGPDARRVSLLGSLTMARPELAAASGGTTPMAGIVTANASVPAGDVTKAAGLRDAMSSGRARACMIAAASADADG